MKDDSEESVDALARCKAELDEAIGQFPVRRPPPAQQGVAPRVRDRADRFVQGWGRVAEMFWCSDPSEEDPVGKPLCEVKAAGFPCYLPGDGDGALSVDERGHLVPAEKVDNVVVRVRRAG